MSLTGWVLIGQELPPLTDLEVCRVDLSVAQVEAAQLRLQVAEWRAKYDELELTARRQQWTPMRDGYTFDWQTQRFVPVEKSQ